MNIVYKTTLNPSPQKHVVDNNADDAPVAHAPAYSGEHTSQTAEFAPAWRRQ
jgi:hypothetical protein